MSAKGVSCGDECDTEENKKECDDIREKLRIDENDASKKEEKYSEKKHGAKVTVSKRVL